MSEEQGPVRVTDKRGANHKPPAQVEERPSPVVDDDLDQADDLVAEQARRAAEEDAANEQILAQYPEGTVFAETAFLVYLRPDGIWVADDEFDKNIAVRRNPHRTDYVAGCAVISGQTQSDIASDLTAAKVVAGLQGLGQQMAARQTADQVQPGAPGGNRAARRGRRG